MNAYQSLLRDLVHDQGEPEHFEANRVQLTDPQLATVLAHHEHIVPEVADEQAGVFRDALENNSALKRCFDTSRELIGYLFVAALRDRAHAVIKLDLECMADDMETQHRVDDEVHA